MYCQLYSPSSPDINECTQSVCDENERCVNTLGSYYCTCKPGYVRNGGKCESEHACTWTHACTYVCADNPRYSTTTSNTYACVKQYRAWLWHPLRTQHRAWLWHPLRTQYRAWLWQPLRTQYRAWLWHPLRTQHRAWLW